MISMTVLAAGAAVAAESNRAQSSCEPQQFSAEQAGGSRAAVLAAVRECIARDEGNPRLHVALGNLLLASGESDKAREAYQKALVLDPGSSTAIGGMADLLIRQGKFQEAEGLLKQLLVLDPQPARQYLRLGELYLQRGDHAGAIEAFREGIKVHEQGRRPRL